MFKFLVTLLFFIAFSFATELKTYNIYERDNRVDLMLSFDSPYAGDITQIENEQKVTLNLTNVYYSKRINESVESKLIKDFNIIPTSNTSIKIEISKIANLEIVASKTIDGYGLRIRAKEIQSPQGQNDTNELANELGTKANLDIDSNYYIVMAILILLLIILFFVRRSVTLKTKTNSSSWLFNKNDDENVKVLFKKPIDAQNSISLVEFYDNSYLIVTGTSNIMLDKFTSKKVKTEDDFQEIFEQNRKKLESYLDKGSDRLKTYKEKVSQLGN